MNFSQELINQAKLFLILAKSKNIKLVTAESCTGGLLSGLITSIPGSSQVFDCGFVTYSNSAKNKSLNVDNDLLAKFGAVSEEVAKAMAIGAITNSNADISLAITGIAGPESDETTKKVGLVFIAFFDKNNEKLLSKKFEFEGDRDSIRNLSLKNALLILNQNINY